jgi:hypothetical protein
MDTSGTTEAIDQDRRRLLGTATMGIAVAGARTAAIMSSLMPNVALSWNSSCCSSKT